MTKSIAIWDLARISTFDSREAGSTGLGESGSLNKLTHQELRVCAKKNSSTCVRIETDSGPTA
jgi:hypothetical protein